MTAFPVYLQHWEEVRGPFTNLNDQDGQLLATIAGLVVALPSELREKLKDHVGQKVAILRADGSDYRFKVVEGRRSQ
jgi:hypothetical protein